MLKLSKLNETIFGDMIKRSYKSDALKKEDEAQIKEFINSRKNPDDYYIEDGLVCCEGNVVINDTDLIDGHFPVKFGKVNGYFDCSKCDLLISLEGAPKQVVEEFDCSFCKLLTSLEGAPEKVNATFYCHFCKSLTSLEGSPEYVGGNFYCSSCRSLTSLKGAPKIVGLSFGCYATSLTSLEGAPEEVGGDFVCNDCKKKFSESDLPKNTTINGKFKC